MISCGYISIRRSIHEAHHRQIDTRDEGSSVLIQHCKRCKKKNSVYVKLRLGKVRKVVLKEAGDGLNGTESEVTADCSAL